MIAWVLSSFFGDGEWVKNKQKLSSPEVVFFPYNEYPLFWVHCYSILHTKNTDTQHFYFWETKFYLDLSASQIYIGCNMDIL